MRKILVALMAITLIAVLGACGNKKDDDNETQNTGTEQTAEQEFTIDKEETIKDSEVVATVNGKDVAGDIYNVVYTQTKIQLYNFGQDVSDLETVKDLTLNAIVDQELLRQDAEERGITVTDEEVENEFKSIIEENEEQLNDFLTKYNLHEEAFKDQVSFALYHEKFIESEIDATISDEEIQEMYDLMKEQNEEMDQETPELEEIKDQLRDEMVLHKEQEMINDIIEELKEAATIEMKI